MNSGKNTILIAMLFSVISVPLCRAATDDVVSGRELLRAVRREDAKSGTLARGSRTDAVRVDKKHLTATELLERWAETQKQCQSFIARVQTKRQGRCEKSNQMMGKDGVFRFVCFTTDEVRFDGKRAAVLERTWGQINPRFKVSKDRPMYRSDLWDGKTFFQYSIEVVPANNPGRLFIVRPGPDDRELDRTSSTITDSGGAWSLGYLPWIYDRVDAIFRKANSAVVRNKKEKIRGSQCYVLDADTKYGKYTIWLDPSHGYHIVRAAIMRERRSFNLNRVGFKKIEGLWFPVKADAQARFIYKDCSPSEDSYHIEVSNIILNPDHDGLRSFFPDDVKDGAEVRVIGTEGRYTWQDGKVVDGQGRKVDIEAVVPKKPKPLVGKKLPRLKELGFKLNTDQTRDKVLLISFFDMNQRPSRHMVRELAKQSDKLTESGVVVACVQASNVDKAKLDEWVKENKIPFEVGMIESDEEKVHFEWGVKSLPWLILTDREQIVKAEGFRIEELARNILQKMQPQQLLNEYQRSLSAFTQVCAIDAESLFVKDNGTEQKRFLMRYEYRRDNNCVDVNVTEYRLDDRGKRIEESPWRRRAICDSEGRAILYYGRGAVPEDVEYTFDGSKKLGFTRAQMGTELSLDGYLARDQVSIIELLSNSPDLHLREAKENVDGFECHVLKGSTDHGRYTLWLDPEHGYLPRKAIVEKEDRHIWADKPLTEIDWLSGVSFTMNSVRIERRQGIFVPVESKNTEVYHISDGKTETHIHNHKRTRIDLEPDFEALGAFVPDIPDGTEVELGVHGQAVRCFWKNGKVVDSEGRDVALTLKELPSLVGKALPQFDGLDVELDVENARGNKSLICFWDVNQRPSRRMVRELAKRAEELKEKAVVVVCVQASKVERQKLDDWVKKNRILFPVGMIEGDEEKIRFSWGVKSLPWLILTDREHIVTAEGFEIDELNEKIKGNRNAEH